jgi:hypothetical protein
MSFRAFRSALFIVTRSDIEVIAVAHHRRKPGYWKSR